MSNLINEILLRLLKPLAAVLLGAIVYFVAVAAGRAGLDRAGAAVWFLCGAAFILLVQEGPI